MCVDSFSLALINMQLLVGEISFWSSAAQTAVQEEGPALQSDRACAAAAREATRMEGAHWKLAAPKHGCELVRGMVMESDYSAASSNDDSFDRVAEVALRP